MNTYLLDLQDLDRTQSALAGGKGANLGELTRIKGIQVPEGFCVSTWAFQEVVGSNTAIGSLLDRLTRLTVQELGAISTLCAEIRSAVEQLPVPKQIADEITDYLTRYDARCAWAVRSSATAEDLPIASFAGQQDTYLHITGKDEVLRHIRKCWASLFTDRAVIYRIQNGFDHRQVQLAVVVQKMVFPEIAGTMFTADPMTGNRKIVCMEAGFGLGEALVSGLVNADNYQVRAGEIIQKKLSATKPGISTKDSGGTQQEKSTPGEQALTDAQIVQLEEFGRKIEAHFGRPQDIEWCLAGGTFYFVQSRAITTLYPLPEVNDDENHVYLSVGHQQMMTDAMKPLGLSVQQLVAGRPMLHAGGRLFVDVARDLASPAKRNMLINVLGKSDPLIRDALTSIIQRGDFISTQPDEAVSDPGAPPSPYHTLKDYDPAIVPELVSRSENAIAALKQDIQTKSGAELFDFILTEIGALRKSLTDPQSFGVIMTAMNAAAWLNEKMNEWLGEKNVADILSQSVAHNITSQMGLALLDVADVIRSYPELITYLQSVKDENFPDGLLAFTGGAAAQKAILDFLDKFGMRCPGEIDITRTRWSERPAMLIPAILSNIKNLTPGASQARFEKGRQQASEKERELLDRLKQLPDGEQKATEAKRMIGLVRNLSGYREYPKYDIVSRHFVYKKALLKEAEKLVEVNIIAEPEDCYYLTFQELAGVVRSGQLDTEIIGERKKEYQLFKKLSPPRVMTSDGEIITGKYQHEPLPAGAIAGLAVSSGIIEGRARVLMSMEDADIDEGDILVTKFTDPSWTPLFVSVKGLVTEVGGLMTHGAVIAREYGLPAVVGIDDATLLIRDGQRIRVNGTDGYVELL